MGSKRAFVLASVLAAIVATGCAAPHPSDTPVPPSVATPAPTKGPSPSPSLSPSPAAVEPTVVCGDTDFIYDGTIVITLTCENAVAAAKAVVGPDPTVTSIEFAFGAWCPPLTRCAVALPNTGYVVFYRNGVLPDLRVVVSADKTGKVTASGPFALPSPSPAG